MRMPHLNRKIILQGIKMRTAILLTLLFVALIKPSGAQTPAFTNPDTILAPISDAQKLVGLSMIWKEASYNFPFFDRLPKLNWDSAYAQFIPRVLATRSTVEYYHTL